jgi:glutamate-1-semialdehyde aminotransferase
MPEELAEAAEMVARGRGLSVNALMLEALEAEITRVKGDEEFMGKLRALTERDRQILDRLAE